MHQSPEIDPEPIREEAGTPIPVSRVALKKLTPIMLLGLFGGCKEKSSDIPEKPQPVVASPLLEPKVPNVQVVGGPAILPFVPSPHDSLPADNGKNIPNQETGAWQPRD